MHLCIKKLLINVRKFGSLQPSSYVLSGDTYTTPCGNTPHTPT